MTQELLTAVGKALARSAPASWSKLELHATAAGRMTETALDTYQADGSVDQSGSLDRDGRVACHELREAMYQPGKGSWYNARLTVDATGQLDADFDYDNPPFDGDADLDLLLDDQRLFPRDPDKLPAWHPSAKE